MADSIHTRARGFIETRIVQIRRDGALPVPTPSPKLAFHIVPLRAFTDQLLEIGHKVTQLPKFLPLECYNTGITGEDYSYRINLEGWLNYYQRKHATTTSYTQIFRNGSIEAVFALDVHPDRPIRPGGIFSEYEVKLVLALRHYTTLMRELLVEPPFVLSLAFLNAQAYYLLAGYSNNSAQPFDRDVVVLPDLVVNESDFDTDMALLSLFDMAWQAVGTERSPRNMNGQFQAI